MTAQICAKFFSEFWEKTVVHYSTTCIEKHCTRPLNLILKDYFQFFLKNKDLTICSVAYAIAMLLNFLVKNQAKIK